MEEKQIDKILHGMSLQIAAIYHATPKENHERKGDLLYAFRIIRRGISKDENGNRYGCTEAYEAMQDS